MYSVNNLSAHFIDLDYSTEKYVKYNLSLLGLSTSFIPTSPFFCLNNFPIKSKLSKYIKSFLRKSILKIFFSRKTGISDTKKPISKFVLPSEFLPDKKENKLCSALYTYYNDDNLMFNLLSRHLPSFRRLSLIDNYKILKDIKDRKDIIIKPSDKNLGITIMSRKWYNKQLELHLNNKNTYLQCDMPVDNIREKVITTLGEIKNPKLSTFLLQNLKEISPSPFYLLPKVHKNPPSTRPITAAHSSAVEPISKLLSHILININTPEVIKNTTHLLHDLLLNKDKIEKITKYYKIWFISFDVTNLYPTMNDVHKNAMCDIIRNSFPSGVYLDPENVSFTCEHIINLFLLVLDINYFSVNNTTYKQISGCAMGTSLSPIYANCSLSFLTMNYINNNPNILFYRRFLDDGFMIYIDDRENSYIHNNPPNSIFNVINDLEKLMNVKLTYDISDKQVSFLDVSIFFDNNELNWRTHQKMINKYLYLPFSSNHPIHQKTSYISSECLRYSRTSSKKDIYINMCIKFFERLRERGIPYYIIKKVMSDKSPFDKINILWKKGQDDIKKNIEEKVITYTRDGKFIINSKIFVTDNNEVKLVLPYFHRSLSSNLSSLVHELKEIVNCIDDKISIQRVWTVDRNIGDILINANINTNNI